MLAFPTSIFTFVPACIPKTSTIHISIPVFPIHILHVLLSFHTCITNLNPIALSTTFFHIFTHALPFQIFPNMHTCIIALPTQNISYFLSQNALKHMHSPPWNIHTCVHCSAEYCTVFSKDP